MKVHTLYFVVVLFYMMYSLITDCKCQFRCLFSDLEFVFFLLDLTFFGMC